MVRSDSAQPFAASGIESRKLPQADKVTPIRRRASCAYQIVHCVKKADTRASGNPDQMIKAKQNESHPEECADSEQTQLVCWNKDAQAQCLRVELNDGGFCILPYMHLTFTRMERDKNQELLAVSFTTHDVHIAGKNLRELGIALQKMAVDWVREVPARYGAIASKDAVFIESIEVSKTAESQPM